ncbi:unnamed protein product [Ilex paraguariensis]|uniref:Major facilitator superfamily (MFS) profile domain-containing protein n=1 Tax=Ilex paraguariensis TaxID=185542 RepID=A0ABC8U932_9AQUA
MWKRQFRDFLGELSWHLCSVEAWVVQMSHLHIIKRFSLCSFCVNFLYCQLDLSGHGPLGWLVPSEIFPLEIRSAAQSINVSVNMIFTFAIAQVFLMMLCRLKFFLFIVFAFFVVLMTFFVYYFLPETKKIPIEEMSQVWQQHGYWKRFTTDVNDPNTSAIERCKEDGIAYIV